MNTVKPGDEVKLLSLKDEDNLRTILHAIVDDQTIVGLKLENSLAEIAETLSVISKRLTILERMVFDKKDTRGEL